MLTKEDLGEITKLLQPLISVATELRNDMIEVKMRLDNIEVRLSKLEYSHRVIRKDVQGLFTFTINLANHVNETSGIEHSGWIMEDALSRGKKD